MDPPQRDFLTELLETASPSGFETPTREAWLAYVREFADSVEVDAYGNAVVTYEGGDRAFAFEAHADEVGYMVTEVDDEGFLYLTPIGGADPSVSRGQHVTVHAADGPVDGVVGQTPVGVRESETPECDELEDQTVDVGAADGAEARALVGVGDPVTVSTAVSDLAGTRIAGRGLDDRTGCWTVAEAFRRAVVRGVDATVYAVITVQEELDSQGARMVRSDVDPDAVVAVDVTDAVDNPEVEGELRGDVRLGGGPVVTRGSANHPEVVRAVRDAAGAAGVPVQTQATGSATETDADAFYAAPSGCPSLSLGLPNRYMHTPVEVMDTADLDGAVDLLVALAEREAGGGPYRPDAEA